MPDPTPGTAIRLLPVEGFLKCQGRSAAAGLWRILAGKPGSNAEETMSAATDGFVHPEFLVETEWLAAHLNDPDLVRPRRHDRT